MDQIFSFLSELAMNQGLALLLSAVVLALLLLCVCASVISGRLVARQVLDGVCVAISAAAVAFLIGFGLSKVGAEGAAFKALYGAVMVVSAAGTVVWYVLGKKKMVREVTATALRKSASSSASIRFAFSRLYGALACFILVAAFLLVKGGQPFVMPAFVVALPVVTLVLHKVVKVRFWYWLCLVATLLFALSNSVIYVVNASAASMPLAAASASVFALLLAALTTLSITKE